MRRLTTLFILLLLLSGCKSRKEVDLILYNGKVITVDDRFSIQEAVVVNHGRIVAVGANEILNDYAAKERIDLQGKTLMPGFNDTHIHIQGEPNRHMNLANIRSIKELQE